ncbi:MAG: FHA domain-containing protein [Planctomycetota bacterium]
MATRAWTIGSGDEVDLRIDDSTVSRKHCRLTRDGDSYFIEDLNSSNGVFVAGNRIAKRTKLVPGVRVILAETVVMPWPVESLAKRVLRVGRRGDNDLQIEDPSVSSNHAVLIQDKNDQWVVRDLNSTNHTLVGDNASPVDMARVLDRDLLTFGHQERTLERWVDSVEPWIGMVDPSSGTPVARGSMGSSGLSGVPASSVSDQPNATDGSTFAAWWNAIPVVPRWIATVSIVGLLAVLFLKPFATGPTNQEWVGRTDDVAPESIQIGLDSEANRAELDADDKPQTTPDPRGGDESEETKLDSTEPPNLGLETLSNQDPQQIGVEPEPAAQTPDLTERLVLITMTNGGERFRIGVGVAISSTLVLTSGRVVDTIDSMPGFDRPEMIHALSGQVRAVSAKRVHPLLAKFQVAGRKAAGALKAALNANDDQQKKLQYGLLLANQKMQRVHDIGCLVCEDPMTATMTELSFDTLSSDAVLADPNTPLMPMSNCQCIGPFFDSDSPLVRSSDIESSPEASRQHPLANRSQSLRPLGALTKVESSMPRMYLCKTSRDEAIDWNFAGCPVVDPSGRWAGMISAPGKLPETWTADPMKSKLLVKEQEQVLDMISVDVLAEFGSDCLTARDE